MIGKVDLKSVVQYDALGFDMDFTIVRYRIPELLELEYKSLLEGLLDQQGYPKQLIVDDQVLKNKIFKMYFRCCLDTKNGLLLKIGTNQRILRAYRGFQRLKNKEIISIYGDKRILEDYCIFKSKNKSFVNFHDFFRVIQVPLVAQIIQLRDEDKNEFLQKKTYLEIYKDIEKEIYKVHIDSLQNQSTHEYKHKYNIEMYNNTEKYIRPVSKKLLAKLKNLRQKGKKVFICSNNKIEMGLRTLEVAVGKDYDQYFDFTIFNAKKAKFFLDPQYGQEFLNRKQDAIVKLQDIQLNNYKGSDTVIAFGNAHLIEQYIGKDLDKDPKILFFGDTIVKDCAYSYEGENNNIWDICFIFEEMTEIEDGYFGEEEHLPYWQYWGSALFDKDIYRGIDKTSLFEFAEEKAHRTFSHLESKECLKFLSIE